MDKPFKIGLDEWWYKGCFMQKSCHPELFGNYEVFADDENQTHLSRTIKFNEAKKICEDNEVKNYVLGIESFGFKKVINKK